MYPSFLFWFIEIRMANDAKKVIYIVVACCFAVIFSLYHINSIKSTSSMSWWDAMFSLSNLKVAFQLDLTSHFFVQFKKKKRKHISRHSIHLFLINMVLDSIFFLTFLFASCYKNTNRKQNDKNVESIYSRTHNAFLRKWTGFGMMT